MLVPQSLRMSFPVSSLWRLLVLSLPVAQLALTSPVLTNVTPPGGQRGTAVRLEVAGTGLEGKVEVHSEIPGSLTELSATGTAKQFLLEIAADAQPGAYPLALETDAGLTNTWLFSVSSFPEVGEAEAQRARLARNDFAARAQPIEVPIVVNGSLTEADRDVYRLPLKGGQRVVVEIEARRLGSAVDPVLSIRSSDGRVMVRSDDSPGIGGDARVDFTAPSDGEFLIEVHDARFSKQQRNFYRLVAGTINYAEAIFPLGWTRGKPVEVELSGGSLRSPTKVTVQNDSVSVPGEWVGLPMPLLRSDDPEVLEPSGKGPALLREGTVVNGRIAQPGETDRYRLKVDPGEEWMVETQAAILGTSQLYTLLVLRDQDGRKLGSAGDQTPEDLLSNISVRAETFGDPSLGFRVPDGVSELQVSIEDLLGRGGPGFAYRLVARRQPSDFILRVDDTEINIPRDGSTSVSLTMDRRGFEGAVRIVAEGLPDGVVAEGGNIPAEFGGMTTQRSSLQGRVTLTATPDAKPGISTVSFHGEGTTNDGRLVRRPAFTAKIATPVSGTNQRPVRIPSPDSFVPAAVVSRAPASIRLLTPSRLRLIQGLTHDIEWRYETHEPGVEALASVRLINLPPVANVRVLGDAKIKPGDSQGRLEMNTTMGTPAMRFDLVLETAVRHEGVRHAIYSPAIIVDIIQGYSLGVPEEPVSARAGTDFEIVGSFTRETEFDSKVVVEVLNLPVGVSCESQSIAATPQHYRLPCRAGETTGPGEYLVEVTPTSVLAGRDKEAVPYNIPPVEMVLRISGEETATIARGL